MLHELIEKHIEFAFKILEEGSSADRQLAAYKKMGDFKAVVDQLIRETAKDIDQE
jgi:carboxylate-amine ligase